MSQNQNIWSVSQVAMAVRQVLEQGVKPFWVKGEVSNLTIHSSGHVYFSIKDAKSQVSCTYFNGAEQARSFSMQDGMEIEIFGSLTYFAPSGRTQIIVRDLRPGGVGKLQLEFEQLKKKLNDAGLFSSDRKRAIPSFPEKIAVISSADGAALHDFLQVLNRRFSGKEVYLFPVPVQGEGAYKKIAGAIHRCNLLEAADVIVLTRGGGSIEDLWEFNQEGLAYAIAESHIPIISAIGHEVDFTISDFVADMRAPTPSAAAELVVKSRREFVQQLENNKRALEKNLQLKVYSLTQNFREFKHRLMINNPEKKLEVQFQNLDFLKLRLEQALDSRIQDLTHMSCDLESRLKNCVPDLLKPKENLLNLQKRLNVAYENFIRTQENKFHGIYKNLQLLNPQSTLDRGYSIVRSQGKILHSSEEVNESDRLEVHLAKGSLVVKVETKEDE
ncbi:exodeoxyribonuclease VII large subunit [Lentisphaera marina]|uniref:exodeoxyribonuclease VII large subunit n=1 Tax=Lentisphaera marina TaxID=1111041 RepID=UPI0023660502|nr:exodeoxyribonuclease VII large subunit [Lentisphaera marina]MDD7986727.1 exodeoxyribonuclease VII large subunit [Lentisphaera marina]